MKWTFITKATTEMIIGIKRLFTKAISSFNLNQPADAMTFEKLQKKINNFLEENDGKIIVKDIKCMV